MISTVFPLMTSGGVVELPSHVVSIVPDEENNLLWVRVESGELFVFQGSELQGANPSSWDVSPAYLTSATSWYVSDEAAHFFESQDPDALALQVAAAVDSDPSTPAEPRPKKTWEEFCADVDHLTEIQRRRRE